MNTILKISAVAIAVGTLAGVIYTQPMRLADNIQRAAENTDIEALQEMIDYSSLDISLRNEIRDAYIKGAPPIAQNDPQALELFDIMAFSAARELTATPTPTIQLLTDQPVYSKAHGQAANLQGVFLPTGGKPPQYIRREGYESFNTYVYRFIKTSDPDTRFDIVAQRKFLTWQVREVRVSISTL